ncbi:lipid-A-disaccharide synthase [Ectothiorhodospira shaposhnikovii]|uniref:lipid-A-disaccharide synthase n=2 Tax=Ectothiorhodospira shaposhnikovii TaxID=1054 RepID=UPI0023E863B6|nr:lipid-A-disaccharide synthase [Ectothiorhodospira shaposhnikovii]
MTDSNTPLHVMVVAGEVSGDLHAANMVRAMEGLRPGNRYTGMGCGAMREAGVELIVDAGRLAVVGLWEVIAQYRDIRRALETLKQHLRSDPPDLLVLVDYVEFNLRLARAAKALGIRVLFYVSPQIWAWRPHRVKRIGRVIDAMAVLFPFEVDVYRRYGIPVRYVGNPLVDVVHPSAAPDKILADLGLDPDHPPLALLPGSRGGELRRHLPIMMETCRWLRRRHPDIRFVMPLAPGVDVAGDVAPHLDPSLDIRLVSGQTYDVMAVSRALIIASGTATLEAALLRTPMAIIYRVSPITHAILSRLILIPHIGLANIVAGRAVVREFVQDAATAENIGAEVERLLMDEDYHRSVVNALGEVRERLGEGGGSGKVARMALELIDHGRLLDTVDGEVRHP